MVANLFGDFVKGKDYSYLPNIVEKGVFLHRQIDDYVDHHPAVTELRLELYKELPKIAGIAIDLYFDHILAQNWGAFSPTPLDQYVEDFFQYALTPDNLLFTQPNFSYPADFRHLLEMMHKHRWIQSYRAIDGLEMASNGLSKRIAFQNNLSEAPKVYLSYKKEINEAFLAYMDDAIPHFSAGETLP